MKILAISDQVAPSIYNPHMGERFGDVDMVLSCGDLPYSYLEFIATMLCVPCFFVHGNHDCPEHQADGCTIAEPGGWTNLDGRSVKARGVLLAGLEGSIRYKPNAPYQYTEGEMAFKAWRLALRLLLNRVRYGRYLDILITHSPPFGIHDGKDHAHHGFQVFRWLMLRFRPRYLLHGHQHIYEPEPFQTYYFHTQVINIYPFRVIEW